MAEHTGVELNMPAPSGAVVSDDQKAATSWKQPKIFAGSLKPHITLMEKWTPEQTDSCLRCSAACWELSHPYRSWSLQKQLIFLQSASQTHGMVFHKNGREKCQQIHEGLLFLYTGHWWYQTTAHMNTVQLPSGNPVSYQCPNSDPTGITYGQERTWAVSLRENSPRYTVLNTLPWQPSSFLNLSAHWNGEARAQQHVAYTYFHSRKKTER